MNEDTLARTCECVSNNPTRRRMDMPCGKPAVGDVRKRETGRTALVCAECLAQFIAADEHASELNHAHLGIKQMQQTHEIHRW